MAVHSPDRLIFNLVNLSENGLQFVSFRDFDKKQTLNIEVNLAEAGTRVSAFSRVVWISPAFWQDIKIYRVGMMFLEISLQDLSTVRRFIFPNLKAA